MTAARNTAAGKAPSAGGAFRRGLLSPSLVVLLVGLAAAIAVLVALQSAVATGRLADIPEGHFLRLARDDAGSVSWRVAQLKRAHRSGMAVYLLGGSNIRECIPSEQSLSAALGRPGGKPVSVYDLGASNEDLAQSMAIIDNLPPGPAVVIISVNQQRLSYAPQTTALQADGKSLLLDSPAVRRFAAAHGGRRQWPLVPVVPGVMSYAASYVQQNWRTFDRGHLPRYAYQNHRYTPGHIYSTSHKRSLVARYLKTDGRPGGVFDRNEPYDAVLLQATVRLARQRGFLVMLMEPPENRDIVGGSFDRFKRVYRPLMARLADQPGVAYAAFGGRLDLVNTDYRDITHLVGRGRVIWQRALAAALAPLLQQLSDQHPSGAGQ